LDIWSQSSNTDSVILVSDGAPPSPPSPTNFIPTANDDPTSYATFSRRVARENLEANSRRDVEKRLAETAAEADRRTKEARKATEKSLEAEAQKASARTAYIELIKTQHAEREAQKAEHQRLKDAFISSSINSDEQSIQSIQTVDSPVNSDLENDSYTTSLRPIRKRKADQIYMSNVAKPVVLVDEISNDLATKFLQHCERPQVIQQNLQLDQVIQPYALDRIRLRLTNTKFHHLVLPEHVDLFPPRIVDGTEVCVISLLEIATIIKKMFNITPEVSDEQSLEQQGREHSFQYTMKSEDLEDISLLQFKRMCSNHIRHMTPELDNRMAVIMGNKMPCNTGMALEFELRTQRESPNKNDTVQNV
jgi:hypothetical protein